MKNPKLVSKYRRISLCNVLYKKISKVLANRLNKILPQIITKHQSAFTKSRLISDNIFVAFKTLHSLRDIIQGMMVTWPLHLIWVRFMIGWSNPFKNLLWEEWVLGNFFIKLLMLCVTSISYSILVNGEPRAWLCSKEILYPAFSSYYVQRGWMALFLKLLGRVISKVTLCVSNLPFFCRW